MFRNKRNSLVKRLWKYRKYDETRGAAQRSTSSSLSPNAANASCPEELELRSVTHSFLKRLGEEQLETLLKAMESRGGEVTPCVPVASCELRLGKSAISPSLLCCRVFRWPNLSQDAEMKRLPSCSRFNEGKDAVVCCNPYHWSQVVKIEEPPIYPDKLVRLTDTHGHMLGSKGEAYHPRIMESTESGLSPSLCSEDISDGTRDLATSSSSSSSPLWCTLAYWELRDRVGRLFPVTEPSLHIFQQLPHGDGMCLRLFQKPTTLEAVKRTREKIGFGIILSREAAHGSHRAQEGVKTLGKETVTAGPGFTPRPPVSISPRPPVTISPQPPVTISPQPPVSTSPRPVDKVCDQTSMFSSTSHVQMLQSFRSSHSGSNTPVLDARARVSPGCDDTHTDGCDNHKHLTSETSLLRPDPTTFGSSPVEQMDYNSAFGVSPPLHPHFAPSQFRSPSCLSSSSSSLSSSMSSSSSPPPMLYLSSDNSVHDRQPPCWTTVEYNSGAHISSCQSPRHVKNGNSSSKAVQPASTGLCSRTSQSPTAITSSSTINSQVTDRAPSSSLPCSHAEVWAYNASDFPIFVNSPTLDDPRSPRSLVVKKVPPGFSIKIFDYARAELLEKTEARNVLLNDGPFDPCSVRISLAKGWGPSYSRQFITSCPCWLEVLLGEAKQGPTS